MHFSKAIETKIHYTRLFRCTRLFFFSKLSNIHVYSDYTFIRKGRVAAMWGHLDVCKYIMENIKDKSPRNNLGETPLHLAAINGFLDVCQYIIENIEDISPRNNSGQTPIHSL